MKRDSQSRTGSGLNIFIQKIVSNHVMDYKTFYKTSQVETTVVVLMVKVLLCFTNHEKTNALTHFNKNVFFSIVLSKTFSETNQSFQVDRSFPSKTCVR